MFIEQINLEKLQLTHLDAHWESNDIIIRCCFAFVVRESRHLQAGIQIFVSELSIKRP